MSLVIRSLAVLGALFAASCSSPPAPSPQTQAIVDSMMQKHPDLVRLSVHAVQDGGADMVAIASSSDDKRGAKSDPEDMKAVQMNDVVVRDEPGAIDVTVPILMQGGKPTAAAGVTLKAPADGQREATVANAKAIANEVAMAMQANSSMPK